MQWHFKLKFDESEFGNWASRYLECQNEHDKKVESVIENTISPRIQKNKCFDFSFLNDFGDEKLSDFVVIYKWKSVRSIHHCKLDNPENQKRIEDITKKSFVTDDERKRIELLLQLDGVSWAVASVLLHFGHKDKYPILDFRSLWSLNFEEPPNYNFKFWSDYTEFCRKIAHKNHVTIRDLDRALWQYSKEKQNIPLKSERRSS